MGLFGSLFGNSEQKQQLQMFNKQLAHDKDMGVSNAAFSPGQNEDQVLSGINAERSDFLKWTQDLEPEVQQLVLDLKNCVLDDDGRIVPKDDMSPLINDLGIKRLLPIIRAGMSKNQMNSNYSEVQIMKDLRYTCDALADHLAENYIYYGIRFTDLSIVMRMVKSAVKPTYFRSLNDGERKHGRSIIKRVEAFQENSSGNEQKKGFLGLIG